MCFSNVVVNILSTSKLHVLPKNDQIFRLKFGCRVNFLPDETAPTHMVFHWSNRSIRVEMNCKLPEGGKEVQGIVSKKENFALSQRRFDATNKYYLANYQLPFIPYWLEPATGFVTAFDTPGKMFLMVYFLTVH